MQGILQENVEFDIRDEEVEGDFKVKITSPTKAPLQGFKVGTEFDCTCEFENGKKPYIINTWHYDSTDLHNRSKSFKLTATGKVGVHTITVDARDDEGKVSRENVNISIKGPEVEIIKPDPKEDPIEVEFGDRVAFEAEAARDDQIKSWEWLAPKGKLPPLKNITVDITPDKFVEGSNSIYVTGKDDSGNEGTAHVIIIVKSEKPEPTDKFRVTIESPLRGEYKNGREQTFKCKIENGTAKTINWFYDGAPFGDGTKEFKQIWTTPLGSHNIEVKAVADDGQEDADTVDIDIVPIPITIDEPEPGKNVEFEEQIMFAAKPTDPKDTLQNWRWTANGHEFLTSSSSKRFIKDNIFHEGENTVIVEADDVANNTSSASVLIYVKKPGEPPIDLDVKIKTPTESDMPFVTGEEITATCEITGGKPEYKNLWEFDGNESKDRTAKFTAGKPGDYMLEIAVIDTEKETANDSRKVTIRDPHIKITLPSDEEDTPEICLDSDQAFVAEIIDGRGTITDWVWKVGEKKLGKGKSISEKIELPKFKLGLNTITLTATTSAKKTITETVSISVIECENECDKVNVEVKRGKRKQEVKPKKDFTAALGFLIKNESETEEEFKFKAEIFNSEKQLLEKIDSDNTTNPNGNWQLKHILNKKLYSGSGPFKIEEKKKRGHALTLKVPEDAEGEFRIVLTYQSIKCPEKTSSDDYILKVTRKKEYPEPQIILVQPKKNARPHIKPLKAPFGAETVHPYKQGETMKTPYEESPDEESNEEEESEKKSKERAGYEIDFLVIKGYGKARLGWICYILREEDGKIMNPKDFNLRVMRPYNGKQVAYSGRGKYFGYKLIAFNTHVTRSGPKQEADTYSKGNSQDNIFIDPYIDIPLKKKLGSPKRGVPMLPTPGYYRLVVEVSKWESGWKSKNINPELFKEREEKIVDFNYIRFQILGEVTEKVAVKKKARKVVAKLKKVREIEEAIEANLKGFATIEEQVLATLDKIVDEDTGVLLRYETLPWHNAEQRKEALKSAEDDMKELDKFKEELKEARELIVTFATLKEVFEPDPEKIYNDKEMRISLSSVKNEIKAVVERLEKDSEKHEQIIDQTFDGLKTLIEKRSQLYGQLRPSLRFLERSLPVFERLIEKIKEDVRNEVQATSGFKLTTERAVQALGKIEANLKESLEATKSLLEITEKFKPEQRLKYIESLVEYEIAKLA